MFKKIVTSTIAICSAALITLGGSGIAGAQSLELPNNPNTIPFTFHFDSPQITSHRDVTIIYASPSFTKSYDPVTLHALSTSRISARDKHKSIRVLNAVYPSAFGYRLYNNKGLSWTGTTIARSMDTGEDAMSSLVAEVHKNDPTSKIILSGYSQGALIAGNVLVQIGKGAYSNIPKNKIYKAIFIGDPNRSAGQAGLANTGLIGGRKEWAGQRNKVVSVCNSEDVYCSGPEGWTEWFGKTNSHLVYENSSFFNAMGLALEPHGKPLITLDSGRFYWGFMVHTGYNIYPDLVPEFYNIVA